MRVVCSGDLHIGRRSSRLPSHVDPRTVTAAHAWTALVDHAIAQEVDLVALSGDLVDQDNRYYESLGPLERGLRRLAEAGIPTVAVAGNHDYSVLPELARALPAGHLHLLGTGGRWERRSFTARDGTTLHVDGWSFPAQHVRENPLATYDLAPATDAPVLGLLHTDLDQPSSPYAPVSLGDLHARPVAMWLLGHVHAPALYASGGAPPVLYPGSLQPLDPGEEGIHGAWLVELAPGCSLAPRQIPLATARYATVDIDVGGAADLAAAREVIANTIHTRAHELTEAGAPLRHLSLRVRLVGRTALHRALAEEKLEELERVANGVDVYVERVDIATRPGRDLERLASGADAASYLARLLVALERGEALEEHRELLRAVEAIPGALRGARAYRTLDRDDTDLAPDALREALAHQAGLLLDELFAQKERVA